MAVLQAKSFSRAFYAALAVAAAASVFPLLVILQETGWPVFTSHLAFGLMVLFENGVYWLLLAIWLALVVGGFIRFGWRGAWMLVTAPVVLIPAYVITAIFARCLFYNYCL